MDLSGGVTRRAAIKEMGKVGLAIAVFGAACTSESGGGVVSSITASTPTGGGTNSSGPSTTPVADAPSTSDARESTLWDRVDMGFVSAYILSRDGEAVLVDTGQAGAAADIEATLGSIGLGWEAVGNVIVTHRHPDHAGSTVDVATAAPGATIHIGAGDLSAIGDLPSGSPQAVGDDDDISGLTIIETPGHTPGHVCVFDPIAGILVAGDALNTADGTLKSSDPRFTADQAAADATVLKLAGFEYQVLLPGHGEPILEGAADAVAALADSLTG